jgi:hypothetical protein
MEVAVSDVLAASDVVGIAIGTHVQLGMEGLGGESQVLEQAL